MGKTRLRPASGASCGPVAVGAATLKSVSEVEAAIINIAKEEGENPITLAEPGGSNYRHQVRAVELLGYDVFDLNGHKLDPREIERAGGS